MTVFGVLNAIPNLPGSLCRGHEHVFDPPDDHPDPGPLHRAAIDVCGICPALTACREWVQGLTPRERPTGVTAGLLHTPKRPRKATA